MFYMKSAMIVYGKQGLHLKAVAYQPVVRCQACRTATWMLSDAIREIEKFQVPASNACIGIGGTLENDRVLCMYVRMGTCFGAFPCRGDFGRMRSYVAT